MTGLPADERTRASRARPEPEATAGRMRLYNFPWGPYPQRVSVYLAEKGVTDLDLVEVEFPHQPKLWPDGFLLGLNPAHSLPVLLDGWGGSVGQSIAILEYLEERYRSPDMLGGTPEARASTRQMVAVLDEATTFFGIWARHGSRLNAERHVGSFEVASVGAERFDAKLRVAEALFVGPYACGDRVTLANCVAIALLEFTDRFYGVPIPPGCPRLAAWYAMFSVRRGFIPPEFPAAMLELAHGLPEQSGGRARRPTYLSEGTAAATAPNRTPVRETKR